MEKSDDDDEDEDDEDDEDDKDDDDETSLTCACATLCAGIRCNRGMSSGCRPSSLNGAHSTTTHPHMATWLFYTCVCV